MLDHAVLLYDEIQHKHGVIHLQSFFHLMPEDNN